MKKITSLRRGKGFTLVECVIALAVFAVLTSMVLMIIGQTVKLSKESTDAEGDLNNVVQNVVQDNATRVYGDDSHTLKLQFGTSGADFSMTYSTVDGYKNFIQCPHCGEKYNNLDFMNYIYETTTYKNWTPASDKNNYKISYWLGQDSYTSHYQCPDCGYTFEASEIDARCDSCLASGTLNTFDYNRYKGNYVCKTCKSESIVQMISEKQPDGTYKTVPISDSLTAESKFMVSGITPNALRYGSVKQYTDKAMILDLTTLTVEGSTSSCTCTPKITYTPAASSTLPGVYTLEIPNVSGLDSSTTVRLKFSTPPYYIPRIVGGNCNGGSGEALASAQGLANDPPKETDTGAIKIEQITNTSCNNLVVKFTLTNYKNNNSFEDDYRADTGVGASVSGETALGKLWYAAGSSSISLPRTESSLSLDPKLAAGTSYTSSGSGSTTIHSGSDSGGSGSSSTSGDFSSYFSDSEGGIISTGGVG
ncbi:MAG: prepilin-type N-terminal cleavage/methylation domain-containing protein [Ruminiclostridium sp.]|nr:prepilin-type N-terminal cleavage/methylation domain-containing protein [Ruminiclostridium sp.]